jgi:hypothetical protein
MEMGKNTIFLSPINFLQVFLSQVGKKLDQGGNNYLWTYDLYSPEHKDFDAGGWITL